MLWTSKDARTCGGAASPLAQTLLLQSRCQVPHRRAALLTDFIIAAMTETCLVYSIEWDVGVVATIQLVFFSPCLVMCVW